jgi:hypothetical protein
VIDVSEKSAIVKVLGVIALISLIQAALSARVGILSIALGIGFVSRVSLIASFENILK